MGKPISAVMRQRLNQQKAQLSGGSVINMKDWTTGTLRCLPVREGEPTPGIKYVSLFSKALGNKSTTSPQAYGKPCPIVDKLAEKKAGLSKEEKQELGLLANANTEYWIPIIHRQDAGDAAMPKLKILPCKRGPYKQIVEYMIAEEGDDITDPDEGRDFIYVKTGSGQSSEYSISKFKDASPLSEDPEYQQKALDLYAELDVRAKFWPVDWEVLEAMYGLLTDGEAIPEHYKAQFDGPTGPPVEDDDDDLHSVVPPVSEAVDEVPVEEAGDSDAASIEVGSAVSFMSGDVEHTGVVSKVDPPAEDGDFELDVVSDLDGGVYGLWASIVTLIPQAEPVEVEPTKPPAKVATPKTAVVKPPVKAPTPPPKPAAKAPVKLPVAAKPPVKPAPAKSVPKPPVKPSPLAKKPGAPASQAIAGKLATMKGK